MHNMVCDQGYAELSTCFLFQAFVFTHTVWLAPLLLIVTTYIMYLQVWWAAFVPSAIIVLQTPVQFGLAKLFSKSRQVCIVLGTPPHCRHNWGSILGRTWGKVFVSTLRFWLGLGLGLPSSKLYLPSTAACIVHIQETILQ